MKNVNKTLGLIGDAFDSLGVIASGRIEYKLITYSYDGTGDSGIIITDIKFDLDTIIAEISNDTKGKNIRFSNSKNKDIKEDYSDFIFYYKGFLFDVSFFYNTDSKNIDLTIRCGYYCIDK